MVVSCQKNVILILSLLFTLMIPHTICAEVRELTDQELDEITASSLSDTLLPNLSEQTIITSRLVDQLLSEVLSPVRTTAVSSDIKVQVNITFISGANDVSLNLTNYLDISR